MKESKINNINSLESNGKKSFSQKTKDFIDNTKRAVRNTIAATGIAASTLVPASVESLTTIAPTAAKVVAVPTAAALVTACHDDLDTTAPRIDVVQNKIEIQGGETLRINGNQVYVGNTLIFRCSDDVSSSINISATFNGKAISSGYTFNESGTLSIKASDEAGNLSTPASSQINKKEVVEDIKCNLHKSEVNIPKGEKITKNGKEIFVGSEKIFAWDNDDYSFSINFGDNKNIQLPYTLENSGDITFTLTNEGKSGTWTTKVTIDEVDNNKSPEITRKYPEDKTPNILGGVTVNMKNNQLLFGNTVMYEGKDDNTETCTPSLNIKGNSAEIKTGETIKEGGTLSYTLTDEKGKSTSVEFSIESKGIDLTNLSNLNMQVDQEADLLQGISIPSGIQISKVEVEINGQRQEIKENNGHYLYTPNKPGTCYIYVAEKGEFGNSYVEKSKEQTIKDIEHQEYQSVSINNIKPVDILPIIGQVEVGDKECYNHIEHLRIAEATRIRDMLWKYGTGKHSPEEYQQLMSRLNTGMIDEYPLGYDNFDVIGGGTFGYEGDNHAHIERSILNSLLNHTNLKIVFTGGGLRYNKLNDFLQQNQNSISIFGCSAFSEENKDTFYKMPENSKVQEMCKSGKLIIFVAVGNVHKENGNLINKTYQKNIDGDNHGIYSLSSNANGKNDANINVTLLATVGTNDRGNADQTNVEYSSSRFPIGFHNKSLFAGRAFPFHSMQNGGQIRAEKESYHSYQTSFTNYVNVAMMDLCFQMFAEVKDVNELLDMVRSTTLTDYIKLDLNGDGDINDNVDGQPETQPLQLINPAGFFKKYLMPNNLPSSIQPGETRSLEKGYYKGVIFNIPGTEVKINGQWVEFNKENESLIKSQNPMNLQWRLNGSLVRKYNKSGTVTGKIIAVDDQRNGLNMDKEISVN